MMNPHRHPSEGWGPYGLSTRTSFDKLSMDPSLRWRDGRNRWI